MVTTLLITLFLSLSVSAQAGAEREVQRILEERDQQIKELLGPEDSDFSEQQLQELRLIVNDMMDYGAMARFALADTFDELQTEQQNEFIDLFARIIRDQSLSQLDIYRARVEYDNIEVQDNKATVSTTAVMDDNRIAVVYRMQRKQDQWVITDMSIDDAWTAESYRRSFQNIIRRRGFDALMDNLRRRAEQA